MSSLLNLVTKNLKETVVDALCYIDDAQALIVYDTDAPLCKILLDGYKAVLQNGIYVDVATVTQDEIKTQINALA